MIESNSIFRKTFTPMLCAAVLAYSPIFFSGSASLSGDVSGNGTLDAGDFQILKLHMLCDERYSENIIAADMDGDGELCVIDGALLLRALCTELPTEPQWILESKNTVHYGEGTYYGGGYEGGCASLDPVSTDYMVAAMNLTDYNNAMLAGAYIELTGPSGTIELLITDLLPEGKPGDVDLNIDAFPYIADPILGRVNVSWQILPLPTSEPVSWKFKEGTTRFWCGVQVRNHRYPVAKLEYLNANGQFTELERRHYNYFVSDEMGEGPFTFRVTSIYGDVFIDKDIPMQLGDPVEGQGQFPE